MYEEVGEEAAIIYFPCPCASSKHIFLLLDERCEFLRCVNHTSNIFSMAIVYGGRYAQFCVVFFFIACACFQIACWFLLIVNSSLMHTRDARALACVDSYGAKRLTTNRSVRAIETTIHSGDSKLLCLTMHCMACRWMAERRTDARGNALLYCIE